MYVCIFVYLYKHTRTHARTRARAHTHKHTRTHALQASNLNELVLKIMKGVFPPIDADTWGSDLQLVVYMYVCL